MKLISRVSKKQQKPPMQFSKQMVIYSWVLMALAVFINFILSWFGKETLSDMVMALITFMSIFIEGGYITQNVFRDTSLNKNKIHLDGNDKHFIEGYIPDAVSDTDDEENTEEGET